MNSFSEMICVMLATERWNGFPTNCMAFSQKNIAKWISAEIIFKSIFEIWNFIHVMIAKSQKMVDIKDYVMQISYFIMLF